ncbi:HAD-IIB family hydrolase [Curvibacter sp. HBC61]|uniref:HAD-IIB family hydrolase n=1 Tax=Curvibacter cyanobacteriorum TaxID=3026422 RepID=A0ABT5N4I0_9BURK|nr:HAD-IIB family hydrolase [Curvibacter sp. HBC61]MDD0840992.1 HAD-IIB family hydrolase [Curvibacter sp. HBC61]
MQPLHTLPPTRAAAVRGVFTDIDDTLTTDGAITSEALQALQALRDAGLTVIAITGRPVGWSEPFAQQWPLNALVAENGAVALIPTRDAAGQPGLDRLYQQTAALREIHWQRMQALLSEIEARVPGAQRATDSWGRETDIAIDHSEFCQLPQAAIDAVVAQMRAAGMNATVSSIHINGWFGDHNKLQGARWIWQALTGRALDAELDQWAYIGDSTNDQLMFEHFPLSVGVANVSRFVPQLQHLPRYVTPSERGAGFAELAQALLRARSAAGTA